MGTVAHLWRHPIKSHGREALQSVDLDAGKTMPWDRHWAVTHDATKYDPLDQTHDGWSHCRNFMIGARTPGLAGIWAELNEETREVTLRHARLGQITFKPDEDEQPFLDWVAPLAKDSSVKHGRIVTAGTRGMTDSRTASVSVMTLSSHAAVAARLGGALEIERWRGNIFLDGTAPWEEFEWIGKRIRIGEAEFEITKPIERCSHTKANPRTGERDAETLQALDVFGHQNFGVQAVVVKAGRVAVGDSHEVL